MRYSFHPEAEKEFIESALKYENQVKGLGERFASEVQKAIKNLLKYPEMASPVTNTFRKFVLKKFPYSLFYTILDETIHIIAVAHNCRKPGYWQSRIEE